MSRRCLLFPLVLLVGSGCVLPDGEGVRLGVPYRAQTEYNYCSAASVSMWRLYDGLQEIPQREIFDWMQSSCGSTNQLAVAAAVNQFTRTYDARWDYVISSSQKESILSRQIKSIESAVPVLAVVFGNHTGIVNGGQWHSEGGNAVWDFVYFHDPDYNVGGANLRITADRWIDDYFCPGVGGCDQIVSDRAVAGWFSDYQQFGDSVVVYGGTSSTNGPRDY